MKTLMLAEMRDSTQSPVWALLDEVDVCLAGLFSDNGGDPDGNAWLPVDAISAEEAASVLAAGLGRMVEAVWLNDDEVGEYFRCSDAVERARQDDDWAVLQSLIEIFSFGWAHYGCYGDESSRWVVMPRLRFARGEAT